LSDGYRVVVPALRNHMGGLASVRGQLELGLDAAEEVTMSKDAYGVLCSFFPDMLEPLTDLGIDTLRAAVRSTQELADTILLTADQYQALEDETADAMGGGVDD
jgi:Excreted virulence factor EspC, type VII ESX diderm